MIHRRIECWTFSGSGQTVRDAKEEVQEKLDRMTVGEDAHLSPNLKVLHQSIAMSSQEDWCEVIVLLTVEYDEDEEE